MRFQVDQSLRALLAIPDALDNEAFARLNASVSGRLLATAWSWTWQEFVAMCEAAGLAQQLSRLTDPSHDCVT